LEDGRKANISCTRLAVGGDDYGTVVMVESQKDMSSACREVSRDRFNGVLTATSTFADWLGFGSSVGVAFYYI